MSDPVTDDRFEVTDKGIKHGPTGAHFVPYSGQPRSGNMRLSNLGNRLKDGRDFRPDEVCAAMTRLWEAHLAKTGRGSADKIDA